MAKRNLLGDCVLRRDAKGNLWLMNRQEGGWRSWSDPVKSEAALLEEYNVRLGEWTKDSCSEYCPVTRIPRSELPTLHDWEELPQDGLACERHAFNRIQEVNGLKGPNLLDDSHATGARAGMKPVVVVDGLNVLTGYSIMGEEPLPESFKPHDVDQRGQSTESVDASRERIMQFYEHTLLPNLPNWTEGYNFFHPGKKL